MHGLKVSTIAGHLGELLQGRLGPEGPVALISLPAPDLKLQVSYRTGPFGLFQAQGRAITRAHLADLLQALGCPLRGRFTIHCPFPVGGGGGASTATRLAIGRLLRPDLTDVAMEQAVLAVEGASDPLLRTRPERLLWASRQARVLAHLPPLPKMRVVGGFAGPPRLTDPRDAHFPDIADLVAAWPAGCHTAGGVAALATLSATRTAALRGLDITALQAVAEGTGALGIAIAHTGAAQALLFPPDAQPNQPLARLAAQGFTNTLSYLIGG